MPVLGVECAQCVPSQCANGTDGVSGSSESPSRGQAQFRRGPVICDSKDKQSDKFFMQEIRIIHHSGADDIPGLSLRRPILHNTIDAAQMAEAVLFDEMFKGVSIKQSRESPSKKPLPGPLEASRKALGPKVRTPHAANGVTLNAHRWDSAHGHEASKEEAQASTVDAGGKSASSVVGEDTWDFSSDLDHDCPILVPPSRSECVGMYSDSREDGALPHRASWSTRPLAEPEDPLFPQGEVAQERQDDDMPDMVSDEVVIL
eukprot:gnl/MRDRNA2_/MRDRNA2_179873_c0_seq1.p1 gnl/MRDRNA2_/MRDRNA2_179873_c0~~gnl/MRDRNA2_/MRDRNA2_179873_c0_seq1.p1  ORF type:complete len:260 (-),score=32.11 gnl/MRDRNA2_/MRDRNA2_179873_c0_seq1:34-813(-)